MSKERVILSLKECRYAEVIQEVIGCQKTLLKAAKDLGISRRQVIRLCQRFRKEGLEGLSHRNRGKQSNRRVLEETRREVVRLAREKYEGFGPTLLGEVLQQEHGIKLSREWLRRFLTEEELWEPKRRKGCRVYCRRLRRSQEGELVQADGSYADWFEGRGGRCCLIVFIDDATGKLQELRFVAHESTEAYFSCMRCYIKRFGLPGALYTVFSRLQKQ